MWRYRLLSVIILLLFSVSSWCQNTVFSVNASANKMGVKDQLQVDYTIQDAPNLRSIATPRFEDFVVVAGPFSRQSSNVSIMGNKMVQSVSLTYSYILQPKKTGTLTVPSTTAKDASGESYQSNSLTIQVVNGSLAKQEAPSNDPFDDPFFQDPFAAIRQQQLARQRALAGAHQPKQQPAAPIDDKSTMEEVYKNLFMRATVDKTKVHVGEQITVTYKLYTRIPMNAAISKLPALNGFWTQDFEIAKGGALKPEEEIVNGKPYQVFIVKKSALFPQQVGTLTLDPAEAQGTARIVQRVKQQNPFGDMFDMDPFFKQAISQMMQDPFGDMFGNAYKDVPVTMKSAPIKIEVLPLPETGKPKDFGNAVGTFNIASKVDKTKLTTDDVLTYTVTISGSGNLKLIEPPVLALPNGLSSFEPTVIDTITGRTTTISGSKIISYSISANVPGNYELPSIPFTYFDPHTSSYKTLTTEPIKITVDKGKHYNPKQDQKTLIADLHPISTKPLSKLTLQSTPLFFKAAYWSMYALPLMAFVGLLVWRRKEEDEAQNSHKFKNKRANKVALKRLSTAQNYLQSQNHAAFYEEISKAVWLYLSDKFSIPLAHLSREQAATTLQQHQVDAMLQTRINEVMNTCETALYTPQSGKQQMQHTYEEAIDIISKLEQVIRK